MKSLKQYITENIETNYIVTADVFAKLKRIPGFDFIGATFTAAGGKWIGNTIYVQGFSGASQKFIVVNKDLDFTEELSEKAFFKLLYTAGGAPTVIKFRQFTKIDEAKVSVGYDDYFYAWSNRIMISRQDLETAFSVPEEELKKVSDFKMQKLIDTVADELKKYSPFDNGKIKVPVAKAFTLYFKGAFGDPEKVWLEEEVDNIWWKEVENSAVKLGIIKQA